MKFVPNAITTRVARSILVSQKNSPQMLFVAGIVGVGATVVLACRATLHLDGVLDEVENRLKIVENSMLNDTPMGGYNEKNARKDKVYIYGRAIGELTKLYGPAVLCGALSVSALAGSNHILSKRNAALVAAYGALKDTFDEYRDRVAGRYGREAEEEIYRDILPCEIEDEETGKKKTVKKANRGGSPYARLFDEHNVNWNPTSEYNAIWLRGQQNYANQLLQARGHVLLNDIYDNMGFERTPAGAVVGWVKDGPDGYIDFGIFNEPVSDVIADFMIGREKAVWLDFNVDGVIYKKI